MQSLTTPPPAAPAYPGRLSRTLAYFASFIALGLAAAILGPTLPGLAEQSRASLSSASILFTAHALGYLCGSLSGGRLYDRLPGHPVLVGTLVVMAASLAMVPALPALWLLAIALGVLGVAEGALDVGGNALLVWLHGSRVGPFMNGLHFFFGLGAFLAPIVVAQAILLKGDISWAYWGIALLMLPAAAWLLRLPSPRSQRESAGHPARPANAWQVGLVCAFFFLYVGAEVGFGGWIFTYATSLGLDGGPAGEARAAYLTSAFWGALTFGRLLSIPLASRFRPATILLVDFAGCLASLGLVLLGARSFLALGLGVLCVGLSMASIFPTMLVLAESRMEITGRVTGWFFVGSGAGAMVLPWAIGPLLARFGPRLIPLSILASAGLALLVLAALQLAFRAPRPAGERRG